MIVPALVIAMALAPTLSVRVEGARSARGLIRVALFRAAEGFPEDDTKAVRTISVAAASAVEVTLQDVPEGTWALAVLHDENVDGRLDKNLVGIPREGICVSGLAGRMWRIPTFEDARFVLPPKGLKLTLALQYWL